MLAKAWLLMATLHVMSLSVESIFQTDKILLLPGQPKVNFQQYSGYITVDEKQERSLFYYFVEADNSPASKPLVLWLNGVTHRRIWDNEKARDPPLLYVSNPFFMCFWPGCSSIGAGAFCEHGPFKPSGSMLVKNDFSWNKEANMLYLESPAGVGFSYSADASFYGSVNDTITARDNLAFLEHWFEKFPQYKSRDFFITGESYAGHYVPQLAELIVHSKKKFNLKGIAIGNPLLEFNNDFNSRGEYLWSHGLISDATNDLLNSVCNYSQIRRQSQTNTLTPLCRKIRVQMAQEMSRYVDSYDVTLDVCLPSINSQAQVLNQAEDKKGIDVCVEDETITYLNRDDVQKAFHARLVGVPMWSTCSDILSYEMQNLEIPTIHLLGSLVKSGIKVLVYSGDQDSVIPLTGTRKLVNGLAKEMGLNTTVPYRPWFQGRQIGGWTQGYGDKLSFASIRGASHEAPFSQPERSLVLFSAFLGGKSLSLVTSTEDFNN